MKIAHVIFTRGFAGSERGTAEMCNAQAEHHQVWCIVSSNNRSEAGASIVERLDPRVKVVPLSHVFRNFHLKRALRKIDPDVVHTHLGQASMRVSELDLGHPTIATLHNRFNEKHARLDGVLCITTHQERTIGRQFNGLSWRIHNSYVPHRRLSADEIARCREDAGAAPDEYLVGGIGRMVKIKAFELLIEAFEKAALPDGRLVIIGEGKELENLKAMAGERVRFLGYREDARDFFQAFDLFVCPSRVEYFGRVCLEALDGGAPVITTAEGEPEFYVPRYGGTVVPKDDVDAMAAAIREHHAARTPHATHDLSQFELPNVVAHVDTIYEELVAAHRAQAV